MKLLYSLLRVHLSHPPRAEFVTLIDEILRQDLDRLLPSFVLMMPIKQGFLLINIYGHVQFTLIHLMVKPINNCI